MGRHRSPQSVRYITANGDEMVISHRLIRYVWKVLTDDPSCTYRIIAHECGLRSSSNIGVAVAILRAAGKIADTQYKPRTILEPFTEESEAFRAGTHQEEFYAEQRESWFVQS